MKHTRVSYTHCRSANSGMQSMQERIEWNKMTLRAAAKSHHIALQLNWWLERCLRFDRSKNSRCHSVKQFLFSFFFSLHIPRCFVVVRALAIDYLRFIRFNGNLLSKSIKCVRAITDAEAITILRYDFYRFETHSAHNDFAKRGNNGSIKMNGKICTTTTFSFSFVNPFYNASNYVHLTHPSWVRCAFILRTTSKSICVFVFRPRLHAGENKATKTIFCMFWWACDWPFLTTIRCQIQSDSRIR